MHLDISAGWPASPPRATTKPPGPSHRYHRSAQHRFGSMRAVISVGQARRQLRAATDWVLNAIEGLPEAVTRGPSMLRGWLWRARQVHHGHDHRPGRLAVGETVAAWSGVAQMRYGLRRRAR